MYHVLFEIVIKNCYAFYFCYFPFWLYALVAGRWGFAVSHPSDENKNVARMGHPAVVVG